MRFLIYSINYILKIGTEFGKYRYLLHNNDSTWHTAHGTLNITAHGTLNITAHGTLNITAHGTLNIIEHH